ncbi:hypothetical protein FJTKL_04531 [Diaporthe vaccinii]|uniref:Uncharacterized protein n=1 Tax=Diaporthe vaccinii TaxID=105482 RepID=A0ABR4DT02_9PEZI
MTDVQKLSVVWHFSRTQVPGELLPPVGLLQVEIPDNGNAKCGHSCCRKLAVTNRAPEEYLGVLRAVSRSTINHNRDQAAGVLNQTLVPSFQPFCTFTALVRFACRELVDCRFAKRLGIVVPLKSLHHHSRPHVECARSSAPRPRSPRLILCHQKTRLGALDVSLVHLFLISLKALPLSIPDHARNLSVPYVNPVQRQSKQS